MRDKTAGPNIRKETVQGKQCPGTRQIKPPTMDRDNMTAEPQSTWPECPPVRKRKGKQATAKTRSQQLNRTFDVIKADVAAPGVKKKGELCVPCPTLESENSE